MPSHCRNGVFRSVRSDQQFIQRQNKYYKDLIVGKIIDKPVIRKITKDGFKKYMNSIGKLGGQNKIPKISNDRKIADQLKNLNLIKQS